ncbi:MAG: transcriptional regulator [Candidatus Caldarchaeum sp.]|nr:transcriptional regulator [Candidatus Caldarchaeum sp.]
MPKDQTLGALLLVASIAGIIVYGWAVFLPPFAGIDILVLKLTGFAAVAAILGIIAWIGYTLATTPPPKPLEEIEKELNEELKKG